MIYHGQIPLQAHFRTRAGLGLVTIASMLSIGVQSQRCRSKIPIVQAVTSSCGLRQHICVFQMRALSLIQYKHVQVEIHSASRFILQGLPSGIKHRVEIHVHPSHICSQAPSFRPPAYNRNVLRQPAELGSV
jgi:hypothetical protein